MKTDSLENVSAFMNFLKSFPHVFHLFFLIAGKLRGRVGVFPSNFVEMIKATSGNPANEDDQTVADKNKRNEKLKGR